MKRTKKVISFIIVIIVAAMLLMSCSDTTDWENVTKTTVVASVDEYEINMDLVKYYYAESVAANKIGTILAGYASNSLFDEAASDTEQQDVQYKACIEDLVVYAALAKVAEAEGVAVEYYDARELAYSELILATKNEDTSMGAYFSQYLTAIKDNYIATDDALCDIAGEVYRLRDSAEAVIKKLYNNNEYESDEDAVKDIAKTLNSIIKDYSTKSLYPNTKNISVDVTSKVEDIINYL